MSDELISFMALYEEPEVKGSKVVLTFANEAEAYVFVETVKALNNGEMALSIGRQELLEDEDEDELQGS